MTKCVSKTEAMLACSDYNEYRWVHATQAYRAFGNWEVITQVTGKSSIATIKDPPQAVVDDFLRFQEKNASARWQLWNLLYHVFFLLPV